MDPTSSCVYLETPPLFHPGPVSPVPPAFLVFNPAKLRDSQVTESGTGTQDNRTACWVSAGLIGLKGKKKQNKNNPLSRLFPVEVLDPKRQTFALPLGLFVGLIDHGPHFIEGCGQG